MAVHHFTETQLPQQRSYNSTPFPAVLSPNSTPPPSVACSVSHLTETIKSQKQFLDSLLHKTGAVLFRGFDVKTAEDFNSVVEAFGYEEYPTLGVTALRTQIFDRVYTSNESPPDQKIGFHHEMPMAPQFPSKLFFYCEVEPATGGETPIALSHVVYEKMKQKHPEFVEKLEEYGLTFTRFLTDDDDFSSAIGRGWKSTFLTEDKSVAEERAAKMGSRLEWMEGGGVKRILGPDPAIHYDESRQRKVWFTSTVGWENAGNDPVNPITFGDGAPLPADCCNECLRILEEECVAIPWQKGDILLIDNVAVLHARRPSKPPRRILASLFHHFTETQLPQQRNYNSIPFPSVLSPNSATTSSVARSVSHLTETVRTQKHFLDSLLHKRGAILFRGFDVKTAEDFNDVVKAFGYEDFTLLGATALRTLVFDRVYTANESPPDQKIGFHHEMAQAPQLPSKLFFFCEVEPASGGETPIVLSHIVYEKMKQKHREFIEKLEEHGLTLTRFLGDNDDPSSPVGRGWKSTFSTEDKSVAEERAAKMGNRLEWMEGGGVKRIIGPQKSMLRKIWFTTVVGWENAGNDPVNPITFGDGTPLPADCCYECLRILEEECVAIPWQKGDILLIDNVAVLHARRPSKPPRRILASLCR